LVNALSDLLNVQNDFLSVWVDYEVQRLGLDFDLGTMQLDDRGMWIDPGSAVGMVDTGYDVWEPPAVEEVAPQDLPVRPGPDAQELLPQPPGTRDDEPPGFPPEPGVLP
jgi:hypothetical protein